MKVTALRTQKIGSSSHSLVEIIEESVSELKPYSILAVTSKIVALCQGRVHPNSEDALEILVPAESDFYLRPETNEYGVWLSIKAGRLIPNAGIDKSNSDGLLVLWPENTQQVANELRNFLKSYFGVSKVGVIITDSTTSPLRTGVTGIAIAHSGFNAVNSLIGKEDIYGNALKMTKVNVADGLAAAAVLVMGECAEQTPLAILEDLGSTVVFCDTDPEEAELEEQRIAIETDLYGHLLKQASWLKGANEPESA